METKSWLTSTVRFDTRQGSPRQLGPLARAANGTKATTVDVRETLIWVIQSDAVELAQGTFLNVQRITAPWARCSMGLAT